MNDTISLLDTTLRLGKNHIDSLSIKSSLTQNSSISIFGIPENVARILIPAIITILVFLLSQFISWYIKKREKQLETQSYRDIILNWIELIDVPVNSQIESCKDFATRVTNSEMIHPERFIYSKMLAGKVDNIGLDRFITTFIINSTHPHDDKNSNMTFNLVSLFGFLNAIEDEMRGRYNDYEGKIFSFMDEWNNYFIQLDKLVSNNSKLINGNTNHPLYNFHIAIINLSNNWKHSAPKTGMTAKYTLNSFFKPLRGLVDSELFKNINNDYAFELSSILQNLKILEKKWTTNVNGNAQVFKDYADKIEFSYNTLVKAKVYFNQNTKVSNIWKIK